jgi:Trk K+ transport system NAD-binding subunit
MKIFVAGATGAVGKRLIPLLVASGYEVVAMTRSPEKVDSLNAAGVEPIVADGLDRTAVMEAVAKCRATRISLEQNGINCEPAVMGADGFEGVVLRYGNFLRARNRFRRRR